MPHTVLPVTLAESKQAAASLANAFQDDKLIHWLIGKKDYNTTAPKLFETWINYTVRYGLALRTENFEAVALRLKPGQSKLTLWRMFRSGMFKTQNIIGKEGLKRLELMSKAIEAARKDIMGTQLFMYCWVLGTRPDRQKQGFGSTLVQATYEKARALNVPCYLETVTGGPSEAVHAKFGYQEKCIIPLEGADFSLTAMENTSL